MTPGVGTDPTGFTEASRGLSDSGSDTPSVRILLLSFDPAGVAAPPRCANEAGDFAPPQPTLLVWHLRRPSGVHLIFGAALPEVYAALRPPAIICNPAGLDTDDTAAFTSPGETRRRRQNGGGRNKRNLGNHKIHIEITT